MTDYEAQKAANLYTDARKYPYADSKRSANEGFHAGAAWQKERTMTMQADSKPVGLMLSDMHNATCEGFSELGDTLDKLAEGVAFMLRQQQDLAAMGLRGSDRGVAILKHLQEIGDNVRGVGSAIGDKFGVVLDAIKHVGETTEAVLDEVTTPEVIDMMEATEPMHADVKAEPTSSLGERPYLKEYISELGKMWADVPVKLEDVSDQTLHELAVSGQVSEARYFEEFTRRHGIKRDPGYGPRKDTAKITIGEPFELADLRRQLETAKMLEAFWRKTAATRGERIKSLGDQVMDMGEMMDRLTGRETGA